MTDYVLDTKRSGPFQPLFLGKRAVETVQLNVIGQKDSVTLKLKDFDVKPDGKATMNLTPDQALAVANELAKLAQIAMWRIK